jgi:glyoxylase-like metal-dependent hydrolase (beta-lactamase superfamily II)/rhodanese-related sulfurtransferase
VIDPNRSDIEQILKLLDTLGLQLATIIDTHTHADHYSGAQILKDRTGAMLVMHKNAGEKWQFVHLGDAFGIGDILRANVAVTIDRFLEDGDTIGVGDLHLKVIFTPGHTNDHIALLVDGHLFTGDVLLIGQAGRSDLPSGNVEEQYATFVGKLLPLPDTTVIHPGHDYTGREFSTLEAEKRTNPFLAPRSKAEYVAFVREFFPPLADRKGGEVVLQCGTQRIIDKEEAIVQIAPAELEHMIASESPVLIDVREPYELASFGAIPGVVNVPVGLLLRKRFDLSALRGRKVVVVCQTGGRSLEAAHYLVAQGVKDVYNLVDGTLGWLRAGKKLHQAAQEALYV